MTKKQAEKRPVGRPSIYSPEIGEKLVNLMSEGRSLDACAHLLGIHPDTIYDWMKKKPDFSEFVRAGKAASINFWESRLLDIATGAPGNGAAITWALKNRARSPAGWHHDVNRQELTGPDGLPIQLEQQVTTVDVRSLDQSARDALKAALLATKETDDD